MICEKKLKNKISKCIAVSLSMFLILGSVNLRVAYASTTINGVNGTSVDYNELDDTPVLAMPNLTFSSSSDFGSNSYLEFSITDADAYDQLGLQEVADEASISTVDGKFSVYDSMVYWGNGSTYDTIGAIDSQENGKDGANLKILFKRTLPNASFLEGETNTNFSDGNTLEGWNIRNGVYDLHGNGLNLRSNGTAYTSMTKSADGKSVAIKGRDSKGTSYTYNSDWYIPGVSVNPNNGKWEDAWKYESVERPAGYATTTVSIDNTAGGSGGRSLKLTIKGSVNHDNTGASDPLGGGAYGYDGEGNEIEKFGSAFGPVVTSDNFSAKAGEKISIDWKAVRVSDDYEVYGYVKNVNTNVYTLVFYGRGASQAWTTSEGIIPNDGNYQFVFINGTYDQTGGFAVGSYLWIDDIQVYGSTFDAKVAQDIALLVNYKCTSEDPESTRKLNIKVVDEDGEASAATASSTINIVNQFSHPPLFTATANNPAYNNGSSGEDVLFSGTNATTIETSEEFTQLYLTASGIQDGENEFLVADGTDIALKDGTSGKTADNSMNYTVTTSGSTFSIALTDLGLQDADMNTLVDNLKYKNTLEKLTPGERVFELVKVVDSGSSTGKSSNETALGVSSTVSATNVVTDLASLGRTGSEASLNWSKATNATNLKIQQSTDDGKTWSDSTTNATLTETSTVADVIGLDASTVYKFRLVVTGGENAGISNIVSVGKSATVNTSLNSDVYKVSKGETANETIADVNYNTSKEDFLQNIAKSVPGQTIDSSNVHSPVLNGDTIVVTAADGSTKTTYTILVKDKPEGAATPNIQIDYKNEKLTGFTTGVTYSMNFTTGAAYTATMDSEAINIEENWFGTNVSITRKGDNINSSDSDAQNLIIPSRPNAPSVTGVNETYFGGRDGKIIGVDSTMEYSTDQIIWKSISESKITGLPNGTYYVRVKAVADGVHDAFVSAIETVTVGSDDSVQQETPKIQFDYKNEQITGFTTGVAYKINGITTTQSTFSMDIDEEWFGTEVSIVKKGNGTTTTDSDVLNLSVPARPEKPSATVEVSKGTNSIAVTNTDAFSDCEYSLDGETWKSIGAFTGLDSGTEYTLYVRKKATSTSFSSKPVLTTITTEEKDNSTKTLSGTVTDEDSSKLSGVTLKITKYGTDGETIVQTVTDENGVYSISGLTNGVYSVVARKDGKTITKTVVIKDGNKKLNIILPTGNKDTVLQVIGEAPSVAADNLENMFTDEDQETAKKNSVKIKLVVAKEKEDSISSEEKEKIKEKLTSEGKVGIYLDLKLQKIINDGEAESIQPPEGQKIKITIAVPSEIQNKAPYSVIRMHKGTADIITPEYDSELQTLTFEADKFSIYTISYTEEKNGSSSSTSNYTITASAGEGGSISPNGTVTVQEGEYKEYTISPEQGYAIKDVLVDSESVGTVTKYSFASVYKSHTIKALFKEAEASDTTGIPGGGSGKTDVTNENTNSTDGINKDDNTDTKESEGIFVDVNGNDWFADSVSSIYEKGIMQGISKNEFGPNLSTTRGMIATIVYRIDGSQEVVNSTFTDVAKDQYYYLPVGWGEKYKVVEGYGNGKYGPNDKITREQLVAILWRYAGSPVSEKEDALRQFSDYNEITNYAKPALAWAYENEIISGKGNNILDPTGRATRAEVASVLNGYLDIIGK